jgi:hypothetical protein
MTSAAEIETPPSEINVILDSLRRIECQLAEMRSKQTIKDFYSTEEVARLLKKAEFTVREWCRLNRINAIKRFSGRGKYPAWAISHQELLRIEKEGLLPLPSFQV